MAVFTLFQLLSVGALCTTSALGRGIPRRENINVNVERSTALPQYALTYAPYSYLYTTEGYWPADISTHVANCIAEVNYASVSSSVTLENIDSLPSDAYLTSKAAPSTNPAYLNGVKPDSSGHTSAPATIIAVNKTSSVDVFYFYFYSFNLGPT